MYRLPRTPVSCSPSVCSPTSQPRSIPDGLISLWIILSPFESQPSTLSVTQINLRTSWNQLNTASFFFLIESPSKNRKEE
ncbi:hypothetical protein PGTUg99_029987 [Puccinia graminis f. sp. tritici]|uniref:Uncharacterized protein n=1 Tax=Puccinia graminis f. sp. tritici TaxID=56615 RepID=A0A5B0QLU8_PUCGR|nr:hypothetical protein PGTUg99_029987 [Puccinia graminis f. sp. tritici]